MVFVDFSKIFREAIIDFSEIYNVRINDDLTSLVARNCRYTELRSTGGDNLYHHAVVGPIWSSVPQTRQGWRAHQSKRAAPRCAVCVFIASRHTAVSAYLVHKTAAQKFCQSARSLSLLIPARFQGRVLTCTHERIPG